MEISYRIQNRDLTFVGDEDDLDAMFTRLSDQVAKDLAEGGVRLTEPDTLTSRIVCRYYEVVDEQCERADLGELRFQ